MKSSKLIQVLSVLTEKEFKEFEKYALQAFYKNEKLTSFIEFLAYYYPHFEAEDISKENTYRFVFKNDHFEDIRVRELMSSLNKVLKEFLALIQLKSSDFYYELNILKQYNKRNLKSHYNSQLKVVKRILTNDNFENKEYYKRNFLLADVENVHFTNKQVRTLDKSIQVKLDNLDYFYFSTKLKESCEMLNRQRLLNQHYNFNLFEDIEKLIEKSKTNYLNQVTITCYYEIYKLLQSDDDTKQLIHCIKIIKNNSDKFSSHELKTMYDFPKNYCISQIDKGNSNYTSHLFELQNFLIDKEFNLINGFISQVSYDNIVTLALKLKKYKWSEKFIEKFKIKLNPINRQNTYNLNKANLYYYVKEYTKTIRLLNQVEFTDIYYAYYSKIILLKTYYSIKEFETLSYFITSFKLYLKRNKEIPPIYKKGADLFLSNFKKIFNIAEKIDFLDKKKTIEKLDKIVSDIQAEKNIHNRAWLLEIIEDLRK